MPSNIVCTNSELIKMLSTTTDRPNERGQTTDAREQNNTGPLGGPVINRAVLRGIDWIRCHNFGLVRDDV